MIRQVIAGTMLHIVLYASVPLPTVCNGVDPHTATMPQDDAKLQCVLLSRDIAQLSESIDAIGVSALGDALYRISLLEKMGYPVTHTKEAIDKKLKERNKTLRKLGIIQSNDKETVLSALSSDGTKRYRCQYSSDAVRCDVVPVRLEPMRSTNAPAKPSFAQVAPVKTCVNMRSKPSLKSKVIACIKGRTQVEVLSEEVDGFALVGVKGKEGWIKNVYLIVGGAK